MRPLSVFGPPSGRCKPKLAVEIAQQAAAFDYYAAIFLLQECTDLRRRVRGKFTNDFFNDILQRYQPHPFAILVHDKADPLPVFLKQLQL